ncbi:CsbD family protein [Brevibacterium sp. 5221]|uniref:CsbD family protein n=1 Tax=Brevibacterium rongguiense TaxID=2695267 RepID=A0A6N9H583_9MICO|nr:MULTISPECIES: CsbD family protein [Brevibacterium]MYM19218.1 CsbD family protein [Brevibacterium rongguiense]WAL39195.1 CsbD family protein [Brevibacterium sp. BRM-1]
MGLDDKFDNKAQEFGGQAKDTIGKATGDEELQAEGKGDKFSANAKQAGEKIKDAGKKIGEAFGGDKH